MSQTVLTDYDALCRRAVADVATAAWAVKDEPLSTRTVCLAHPARARIETLALAAFDDLSGRRGDEALLARLDEAVEALEHAQHDDGLIDLSASNFHSPPDAAFMIEDLVPLVEVVAAAPPAPARDAFCARLERIIVAACDGIAAGGVHTPNHRWKVASALMLADRLWPNPIWRAEAQAYLDEGIDIDADGEYTERSTGCYNHTCDRAMILLARTGGRGDLAEYADRNLEHMLYLLHPDGTLVTNYSRRQDRDVAVGIERYFLLYWYRAMMADNGRFLSAAALGLRRIEAAGGTLARWALWLRYFRDAGARRPPAPEPLPEEYEKTFDGVGVLRWRRGDLSLTLMADSADVLAVRFGAGPEVGLRVAAGLAPRGQFRAAGFEEGPPAAIHRGGDPGAGGRYRLRSHHRCEYFGPGPDHLPATDWRHRPTFSRRVFVSTELTLTLDVDAGDDAVTLHLRTTGCPHVPVEVALAIRQAEAVEADGELVIDDDTGKRFLNRGALIVRGRGGELRIGDGACEHDFTEIATGQTPRRPRQLHCLRLLTPIDTTVTLRRVAT